MTSPPGTAQRLIARLTEQCGAPDPVTAIRMRAQEVIDRFVDLFGEPERMPLDLRAVASFLGIRILEEAPAFSRDAEIAPALGGGTEIRLNPERPEARQRFSIGHEITHTFFPEYSTHLWPRADARYRDLTDPDDYLEMLCDVGAAELVLPRRWFERDAVGVRGAHDLLALGQTYQASRQATVRRYAELHPSRVAAVFLSWKLKPTQRREVGRADQPSLFGFSREESIRDALRLRVSYAVPSEAFRADGFFVPRDKSVDGESPLSRAAETGVPTDGECNLQLGQSSGRYRVSALPLWTPEDERGPCGECAVAAILEPLAPKVSRRNLVDAARPSLF